MCVPSLLRMWFGFSLRVSMTYVYLKIILRPFRHNKIAIHWMLGKNIKQNSEKTKILILKVEQVGKYSRYRNHTGNKPYLTLEIDNWVNRFWKHIWKDESPAWPFQISKIHLVNYTTFILFYHLLRIDKKPHRKNQSKIGQIPKTPT